MTLGMLILAIITSLFVLAGVFLPIYAIFRYPVPSEAPVHRQIARAVGVDQETIFDNFIIAPALNVCHELARRCNIPTLRKRIHQDLNAAGNPSGYSIDQYLAIALFSAVLTAVVASVLDLMILGGNMLLITLPSMAVIGFMGPLLSLHAQAQRRVLQIARQLPYTLDLIALVMSAGSSFTQALETLIRDHPEDELNQELQYALSEMEYGATRQTALQNLAHRIPLESLRSVIGAVNQAEALGTQLSTILKLQADMLRMHRSVNAEKLSASASLKILIPSMLILLAVIVIVAAPLVIYFIVKGSLF